MKNKEIIEALEGIFMLQQWQMELVRSLLGQLSDADAPSGKGKQGAPRRRPPVRKRPRKS